MINIKDKI